MTDPHRRRARTAAALVAAAAGVTAVSLLAAGAGDSPTPTVSVAPQPAHKAPCPPLPSMTRVVRVIDGDTLTVESGCAAPAVTIRVIGINTPETVKRGSPVQCWGPQASTLAHRLLDRQRVMLTADPDAGLLDLYGRHLAHVFVLDREEGAELYGLLVLRAGAAEARGYGHRHAYEPDFAAAQAAAKKARRGAWRACPRPFVA